jgi:hypothetical protein
LFKTLWINEEFGSLESVRMCLSRNREATTHYLHRIGDVKNSVTDTRAKTLGFIYKPFIFQEQKYEPPKPKERKEHSGFTQIFKERKKALIITGKI